MREDSTTARMSLMACSFSRACLLSRVSVLTTNHCTFSQIVFTDSGATNASLIARYPNARHCLDALSPRVGSTASTSFPNSNSYATLPFFPKALTSLFSASFLCLSSSSAVGALAPPSTPEEEEGPESSLWSTIVEVSVAFDDVDDARSLDDPVPAPDVVDVLVDLDLFPFFTLSSTSTSSLIAPIAEFTAPLDSSFSFSACEVPGPEGAA